MATEDSEFDEDEAGGAGEILSLALGPDAAGGRLDKTLAGLTEALSRARIQALIAEGRVSLAGVTLSDASAKAVAGDYRILVPPPAPAEPEPEAIALDVLFEDDHLIVVNKSPGWPRTPRPAA